MSEQTAGLLITVVAIVGALVFGVFEIIWANECAAVGGAFIIPQNSFPVCVQGVVK